MHEFRPPSVIDDDARLARALQHRNEGAIRELCDRFAGAVHAVSVDLVGPGAGAERATVETLARACREADALDPGQDFAPWLTAIALDVAHDEVADGASRTDVPGRTRDGAAARRAETVWTVRRAVDSLRDDERAIVRRLHLEAMPVSELTDDLGLDRDEVVAGSERAHRRLDRRLGHLAAGPSAPADPAAEFERRPGSGVERRGETEPLRRDRAAVASHLADLLGRPSVWAEPPEALGSRVVVAAGSAATVESPGPATPSGQTAVAAVDVPLPESAQAVAPHGQPDPSRSGRFRTALLGAVVALALLVVVVVTLSAIGGNPRQADFTAQLVPTGVLNDVTGEITVTSRSSGLEIELTAPSLPRRSDGEFYAGRLRLDDGRLVPAGTFQDGDDVTLWAGVERDRVVEMTVVLAAAVPPDATASGGAGSPDGRVVLKVDFPAT